tara:strand:- start:298 stop:441 length:144 start_codon:yes stop_codon:yes gene_type:complete
MGRASLPYISTICVVVFFSKDFSKYKWFPLRKKTDFKKKNKKKYYHI